MNGCITLCPMPLVKSWRLWRTVLLVLAAALAASSLTLVACSRGVDVLVLTRALSPGDALVPDAITRVRVPEQALPADALTPDDPLPESWPGGQVEAGTILSESIVSGSALGRSLNPGKTIVSVVLDQTQLPPVEGGDRVDLWGLPHNCDEVGCSAALLAQDARISSVSVSDAPAWESSAAARLDIIVNEADVRLVLGHAGTGTLSLALRPSHAD